MSERGPDVRGTVAALLGRRIPGAQATVEEVQESLAFAAAAVADAHAERDQMRAIYGLLQKEMVVLATIMAKQTPDRRLVVRYSEYEAIANTHQLRVSNTEDGVRIYSLERVANPRKGANSLVLDG